MATATKTKKKTSEVKKLAIIKHAKHLTLQDTKAKGDRECLKYVYYDGEALSATNMKIAVQVNANLPNYEAGTYFNSKGEAVKPTDQMKKVPFPLQQLNQLRKQHNLPFASITLNKEQIEELYRLLKSARTFTEETIANIKKSVPASEIRKSSVISNALKNPPMRIDLSEESDTTFEVKIYDPILADQQTNPYRISTYSLPVKGELSVYYKKPNRYKHVFETFPMLKQPILVNPLHLYWVVHVLKQHGAKTMKIYRAERILIIESNVGWAMIVMLIDYSYVNSGLRY